ncbi:MAG: DivIVA domain-containing protein [Malacoplasma sp.]|nr:DivIVA domain-containing protein [Malacoplasma sp.]
MKNNIKKVFDEILNHRFSKNLTAGYDPLEVDMFLDSVRNFLIDFNKRQEEFEKKISEKNNEIYSLKDLLNQKQDYIKGLVAEIESLKKDGYQSQKMMSDMGKMQMEIAELKNKKRD